MTSLLTVSLSTNPASQLRKCTLKVLSFCFDCRMFCLSYFPVHQVNLFPFSLQGRRVSQHVKGMKIADVSEELVAPFFKVQGSGKL